MRVNEVLQGDARCNILSFDEDDLRRTLSHLGITVKVTRCEAIFSNGVETWATDLVGGHDA